MKRNDEIRKAIRGEIWFSDDFRRPGDYLGGGKHMSIPR